MDNMESINSVEISDGSEEEDDRLSEVEEGSFIVEEEEVDNMTFINSVEVSDGSEEEDGRSSGVVDESYHEVGDGSDIIEDQEEEMDDIVEPTNDVSQNSEM